MPVSGEYLKVFILAEKRIEEPVDYKALETQARALIAGEPDLIANLANVSSLIWHTLPDLNWSGFYLMGPALKSEDHELVLGPFQGKPACLRIPLGKGVCGTAAATGQTQLVPDVHAFPGHIACDAASRSEIVVPLLVEGQVVGVLDLDSPLPGRFTFQDKLGLEKLADFLISELNWRN